MAINWSWRALPFTIDTYDSSSAYDADEMYDGVSLTSWAGRTIPVSNYTWDTSTMTWDQAAFTWDWSYTATVWSWRTLI